MKKRTAIVIGIIAFLAGVLACHLYYYTTSYLVERKIQKEIEVLKKEYKQTQQKLDQIDSLLNQMP